MAKILMLYATHYGQTRKISETFAQTLTEQGHDVTVRDVQSPVALDLRDFNAVVVGAPVYRARFSRQVRKWLRSHSAELAPKPTAFFSVCLGVLERDEAAVQAHEQKIVRDLCQEVGWEPTLTRVLPGGLPYTRYGWLTRWMMKRIAAQAGGDTDTRRDYDYTDRAEVQRFAREFSNLTTKRLTAHA